MWIIDFYDEVSATLPAAQGEGLEPIGRGNATETGGKWTRRLDDLPASKSFSLGEVPNPD